MSNTPRWAPSVTTDNSPTVSWVDRMASKAKTPTAGRLLRGLALMLHYKEAGRLTTVHVPGTDNILADIASRPAKAPNLFVVPPPLSDNAFCTAFDSHFPLPNNLQWTLAVVPPWLRSNVCGTLRGSRLALLQWMGLSAANTGKRGRPTVASTIPHPAVHKRRRTSPIASLPLLSPCGKVSTASELLSMFNRLKRLSGTSLKELFWTDIQTPEKPLPPNNILTSPSPVC